MRKTWSIFGYVLIIFVKSISFEKKISHDKQYGWAIGIELRFKKIKKWKNEKNENEEISHAHHFANNTKDSHVSSINPISNILQ